MSEKSIERLNYFNGQRLEAEDLRLEQEYHVRIQRWLSKSLFLPGVADGFEVFPIDDPRTKKKTKVLVTPGLALDDLGRAIILINAIELVPQAAFLCVRYAEWKQRVQEGECRVNGSLSEHMAAWGGPGRITSEPELLWRREPPLADTRELIIAELKLGPDCNVEKVVSGPRRLAVAAPLARVRALSFEGEKDIDKRNPKVLRFYVAHRRPTAVTLHLWSKEFSSLYYTEMAEHNHNAGGGDTQTISKATHEASQLDPHNHGVGSIVTGVDGNHAHTVVSHVATPRFFLPLGPLGPTDSLVPSPQPGMGPEKSFGLAFVRGNTKDGEQFHLDRRNLTLPNIGDPNTGGVGMEVSEGDHQHKLSGKTDGLEETALPAGRHTHQFEVTVTHSLVGATGKPARSGPQLSFLHDLQITVDTKVCTSQVLKQIKETHPSVWGKPAIASLGDGKDNHVLETDGTGPIRLDLIEGLDFEPDQEHEIRLSVSKEGNGGCIQYNLYVE